ncbi:hypothetical protein JOQ06_005821, partial [Pogonophryne albipinna]
GMFTYPPSFSCKSTGDATREKSNKTNSGSQRRARFVAARVPVSGTSCAFSSILETAELKAG